MELPLSAKGVLLVGESVLLGRNDRDEWELPGGRPDPADADLEATVRREFAEEAGILVEVGCRLADEVFEVVPGRRVRVVSFACASSETPRLASEEHLDMRLVPLGGLGALALPGVYRRAIDAAVALRAVAGGTR
jgi:8-oxo-dGTP pyrophosphatase MutT (NUDIX family)